VIGALRVLEAEWNARKAGRPHFEDDPHPINLNIGRIEGGDWASSVPAWCRLDCRIAIFPGTSAAEAAREIEAAVVEFARQDAFLANQPPKVTFNGFFAEGYVLSEGSEAERVLAEAHESATGNPLTSFMTAGYLDTRVHALYDRIPALCYGPVSERIHGFDERVSLSSVQRITAAMALFIAEWCGLERSTPETTYTAAAISFGHPDRHRGPEGSIEGVQRVNPRALDAEGAPVRPSRLPARRGDIMSSARRPGLQAPTLGVRRAACTAAVVEDPISDVEVLPPHGPHLDLVLCRARGHQAARCCRSAPAGRGARCRPPAGIRPCVPVRPSPPPSARCSGRSGSRSDPGSAA
jgi:hypothetical protein